MLAVSAWQCWLVPALQQRGQQQREQLPDSLASTRIGQVAARNRPPCGRSALTIRVHPETWVDPQHAIGGGGRVCRRYT